MNEVDVATLTGPARIRLLNRLLRNIDMVLDERGCWEWRGTRLPSGYGKVKVGGRMLVAHRVLYELRHGPVPVGLELDHLCRNRACVKPDHLEPVTRRENVLRGVSPAAVNAAKDACSAGHPFDEGNTHLVDGGNGAAWRVCRACNRAAVARYKAKGKNR